jgi:hypothetical protein
LGGRVRELGISSDIGSAFCTSPRSDFGRWVSRTACLHLIAGDSSMRFAGDIKTVSGQMRP